MVLSVCACLLPATSALRPQNHRPNVCGGAPLPACMCAVVRPCLHAAGGRYHRPNVCDGAPLPACSRRPLPPTECVRWCALACMQPAAATTDRMCAIWCALACMQPAAATTRASSCVTRTRCAPCQSSCRSRHTPMRPRCRPSSTWRAPWCLRRCPRLCRCVVFAHARVCLTLNVLKRMCVACVCECMHVCACISTLSALVLVHALSLQHARTLRQYTLIAACLCKYMHHAGSMCIHVLY